MAAFRIAALLAACASTCAFAQVSSVEVRKLIRYEQIGPATTILRTDIPAYEFRVNVFGNNIGGIAAPTASGPFNVASLGAQHNNGVLVYDAPNGAWRWGQGGTDYRASTRTELDSLFPNGTYQVTIPAGMASMGLTGDIYPVPGRLTLSGGSWVGGAYHIDPSQALTVTTSAHGDWGSYANNHMCLFARGTGFNPFGLSLVRTCLIERLRTNQAAPNSLSFTFPAGSFIAGEEYTLNLSFQNYAAQAPLPGGGGSSSARYQAATIVRLKTSTPVFPMTVTSDINGTTATASAQIQFRPQDVGTQGSVYVFALAPQDRVQGAQNADVLKVGHARGGRKADTPIACVLAQLNASGQMVAVSSANLAAYLTGVLSAQGASVSILNGVPTGNVSGATFFVGYGSSSTSMINTGVNRSAVTIPGSLTCLPSAPQTGWWWNPAEDGRGFSIEKRGNNLFFAAFLYDVSGRSSWLVSTGPVSLEGSLYSGDLLSASGGQTLTGPYERFPTLRTEGTMTMTFNNESTGTIVWPGGTVPIQRFNIIPNGLTLPSAPGQPESGWWWNENEAGRGFFLEFQNGWLDIAGYMYDDLGNPVWYLNVGQIGGPQNSRSFSGSWWSYGNGMTLAGPWRQHTRTNDNVGPVFIQFTGPATAVLTLPNSRTTNLRRHRF